MDKQVEAHMDILRSNTFHFNPKNRKRKTEEELTFREIVADNFPQLAKSLRIKIQSQKTKDNYT